MPEINEQALNRALEVRLFGNHIVPDILSTPYVVVIPGGVRREIRDYAGTGDGMLRVIVALEAKGYHCGMDWRDGWRYVWVRNSSGAVGAVAPTWPAAFALAALRAVAPDIAEQLEKGDDPG